MSWFNYYGLILVALLLLPNIVATLTHKISYSNQNIHKSTVILEQIGRFACLFFMIFNIPYTWIGFYLSYGLVLYLVLNGVLLVAYGITWAIFWNKGGMVKTLLLSCIPSVIFLVSGILIVSVPLIVFSILFAACHITISVKNELTVSGRIRVKTKGFLTAISLMLAVALVWLSVFGGFVIANQNLFKQILTMSAQEMIAYDCHNQDVKISVAVIEGDSVSYYTYSKNGEEAEIYDYEIGSVSKTFVGLMIAKAESEGKLNLTDSISQYLDLSGEQYYPTIERLLTHTAGYPEYYFEGSMIGNLFAHIDNDFYGISREKLLEKVKTTILEDKDYPFVYSNFGISVLGLVLEKIYGQDFYHLMNDFISNELNLPNTAVAKQGGNLSGYWPWNQTDGYLPAGAIHSNIVDMASYLQCYLGGSLPYIAKTYQPVKQVNANNASYELLNIRLDAVGMTWILDEKNGVVWHNGATTNFNSYVGFTKDRTKGVVVLGNLNANERIPMSVIGAKLLLS